MTDITGKQLDEMLQQTQYAKHTGNGDEYWFSFPKQKVLAYNLACELVIAGHNVEDAIETAKEFIDEFYFRAMKPHSWERP